MRLSPTGLLVVLALSPTAPGARQGSDGPEPPCFGASGGPGGDFDVVIHGGEVLFLDTALATLIGGPGGLPVEVQTVVDGVVQVRHLTIEAGGELRAFGPNPLRILATGDVTVRGTLDVSGFAGRNVATLNTGNQTEQGGSGGPGAGGGGDSNLVTTGSSPRGGAGRGAFGLPGVGGQGGETGYALGDKNNRRPGGGGGGRFARDLVGLGGASGSSLVATAGTNGHPLSTGAESGLVPAQGGAPGPGPFQDDDVRNDFFGFRPILRGGYVTHLRGELPGLWSGAGGGGGGNANPATVFPTPNWQIGSDEKGGPGGGGGGTLHVQALGRIVFGPSGTILANGKPGGTGENTNFLDHVGGTGGGGSGGHVVLESAVQVDFTDNGTNLEALPRAWVETVGAPLNRGPLAHVDACCRNYSNGGAGGAGVVQVHVPNPIMQPGPGVLASIRVPLRVAQQRDPLALIASQRVIAAYLNCAPLPGRWPGAGADVPRAASTALGLGALDLGTRALPRDLRMPLRY